VHLSTDNRCTPVRHVSKKRVRNLSGQRQREREREAVRTKAKKKEGMNCDHPQTQTETQPSRHGNTRRW
jgi:hypothetical protein